MPVKHRTTGATVQRAFDLARAQKMAETIAAAQDINQTGLSTDFIQKTAAALADKGPDRFAAAKEYVFQTLGAQPDPDKCLVPGCKLCYTEIDKQQKPATPPLSPKEELVDPSSWQIIEPVGKKTVSFAEAEPENDKPELPAEGYPSPSASSASIGAKEVAGVIEAAGSTTSGSGIPGSPSGEAAPCMPGMALGSPFPESPPLSNITVTTEVHSTTFKHYVYALRIEYRFNTNIGGPTGFHDELGTLSDVMVRDVFDNLEAANKEVKRLYKQLMKAQELTEMDAIQEYDRLHSGDRLFVFLDNPRTFESWSIYTDERVLR